MHNINIYIYTHTKKFTIIEMIYYDIDVQQKWYITTITLSLISKLKLTNLWIRDRIQTADISIIA